MNVVVGFKPELWREISSDDVTDDLASFDKDLAGINGTDPGQIFVKVPDKNSNLGLVSS